jgi:adenylate cyclase
MSYRRREDLAMPAPFRISVYENRVLAQSSEFDGPVELGRQRDRDEEMFSRKCENNTWRWVIARRDETTVGRNQMLLSPMDDGRIKITNGSDKQPIRFLERADLQPGASCEASLPVLFILGPTKTVRIERPAADGEVTLTANLRSLVEKTQPPLGGTVKPLPPLPSNATINNQDLIRWMNAALDVLQAAAGSNVFFQRAAEAAVNTGKLDSAQVLQRERGNWVAKATTSAPDVRAPRPSAHILSRMLQEKRTFFEEPHDQSASESLVGLEVAVAAPILDCTGDVIGALYGTRRQVDHDEQVPRITELDAMLIELLARGVAAGLARLENERDVARAEIKARYAPFFAATVIDEVIQNGAVLRAREKEVTVLFADMRGFTRIGQRLGVRLLDEWCRQILDQLSDCVLAEEGVLVDFIGDGMMALWNAPKEQEDHAARACRSALKMLESLVELNKHWYAKAQEGLTLGIGIHTGSAHVGNVGSSRKFKYGPRGPMVNLASRIEGVTKQYPCTILISSATEAHLSPGEFFTRRLGRVQPVSVQEAVEMHELVAPGNSYWPRAREEYETALGRFESRQFGEAVRLLGIWRAECADDGPALRLLERAVQCLTGNVPDRHPVWELKGK